MFEEMKFPDTLDEFIKQYSFIDEEQIYTNGSELIHTFRVKQWEEHKEKENQKLRIQVSAIEETFLNQQKEFIEYLENMIKIYNRELIVTSAHGNYDMYEEIRKEYKKIFSKYKEIIGDKE